MRNFIVILLVFFISCKEKNNNELELVILNNSIVSFQSRDNSNDININMLDSNTIKKSKTIIVYKLTNHSRLTYYFNMNTNSKFNGKINGLTLRNGDLCIYDNEKKLVKINTPRLNFDFNQNSCLNKNFKISKFLNYSEDFNSLYIQEQLNFIIHPNETLYFEWFVNLPYGNEMQKAHLNLDNDRNYYAKIFMFSDSTNYKKELSRTTLQTIKTNNIKVYHGIIESKNSVPVKIIE